MSDIINRINKRFGTDFTLADKLFFDQVEMDLVDVLRVGRACEREIAIQELKKRTAFCNACPPV
ncbi:MAG TPA: hypothetical protein VK982_15685 [Bacteroidales bacterium]|nr:hypothetical protein [Bacteroidales bacterium]